MTNAKQMKMENPIRIAELNAAETLQRIGMGENDVICDIGAGSGIFTIPAAKITKNTVYSLEIDEGMLEIITEKSMEEGLPNIEPIKVAGDEFEIKDQIIDIAFLVTVLHEIEKKDIFLREIKRILKYNGKIMVIEFHKCETPMGPPEAHRIGKDEVERVMNETGFEKSEEFNLGDNFYCIVFQKAE